MSTETRLKPCPFCGGAAKEFERFNANVITCRRCGVKVRQSEMGEGDAAVRWNQRATPVAAQAQQPVSGADRLPVKGDPWSGWACQHPGKLPRLYGDKAIAELNHHPEEGDRLFQLAECTQQDADKVDAALAEMVHAMFRSGNSVPVTRITIDRKQYDAAIDAARKEQA